MKNSRKSQTVKILGVLIFCIGLFAQCKQKASYEPNPESIRSTLDKIQKKSLSKYSLRSGGADEEKQPTFKDTLSNALNLSVKGKYKESKTVLLNLSETHPENEELLFQIAVQDYYLGNYAKSIERLTKVVKSSNKELRNEAEFIMFHATTTLDDNFATAKKYLNIMAKDMHHPYHKDAKYQLRIIGD